MWRCPCSWGTREAPVPWCCWWASIPDAGPPVFHSTPWLSVDETGKRRQYEISHLRLLMGLKPRWSSTSFFNTYLWLWTNDSSTSLNNYMTENIICKIKIYMYFLNKINRNLHLSLYEVLPLLPKSLAVRYYKSMCQKFQAPQGATPNHFWP